MINGVAPIIKRLQKIAVSLLLLVAILGACSGGGVHIDQGAPRHVFVIVMENKSAQQALSGVYTAHLAATGGVASNYRAIAHPSVPNYLALTSGSTWGVHDDSYHILPKKDLGTQLTAAGVTWRAYMEGLGSRGCLNSPVPYDPGHNPFAYYGGACPANVVPLTRMAGDLIANTPRFIWITPAGATTRTNARWLRAMTG
jgi:hypothetical protein